MNFLKKDSIGIGILIGIILPALLFALLFGLSVALAPEGKQYLIKISTLLLIAMIPDLILMRYYLINLKLDKTGRGIMLATFVLIIVYFVYFLKITSFLN